MGRKDYEKFERRDNNHERRRRTYIARHPFDPRIRYYDFVFETFSEKRDIYEFAGYAYNTSQFLRVS